MHGGYSWLVNTNNEAGTVYNYPKQKLDLTRMARMFWYAISWLHIMVLVEQATLLALYTLSISGEMYTVPFFQVIMKCFMK